MSLAAQRTANTAWPAYVVEVDLDYVTSTTSPTNSDGTKCYNTPSTSQSFTPLTVETKTRRWVTRTAPLWPTLDARPIVEAVSFDDEKLKLGEALGKFGQVTITLRDFEDDDRTEDPFLRGVTGSYLKRLKARNPYIQGRECRVWSGYLGDGYDEANGEWRTYYLKSWGDIHNGTMTLKAIGPLQLTTLNEKTCPAVTSWQLDAAITAGDTTATIKAGFYDDADDDTSGYLVIGEEICAFTRSDATLTLTRAQFDTTADGYGADEKMQIAAYWSETRVDAILEDILTTYANLDASLIPSADWSLQADTWLSTYSMTVLIPEPEKVIDLLNELSEQCGLALWWSALEGQIQLLPIRPAGDSITIYDITDDDLIGDPVEKQDISRRVSRTDIFFNLRTPTADPDRNSSYAKRLVGISVGAGEYEHGEESLHIIHSRWFNESGFPLAARASYTISSQLQNGVTEYKIVVSKRDAAMEVGELVRLSTTAIVDINGDADSVLCWITSRKVVQMGERYEYTLTPSIYTARYAVLASSTAPTTYAAATNEQRDPSFYLAGTDGLMPNGDPGYGLG